MTDKTQDAINLGQKAKALLEDDAFGKAFETVEAQFIERWKMSTNALERDRCWMAINLAGHIRTALVTYVNNGKLSQSDLNDILSRDAA